MLEAGPASSQEKTFKLLDVSGMSEKIIYKVQVVLGRSNCPWKLANAILYFGAGSNTTKLDAMDPSRNVTINDVKSQGLCFTAGTFGWLLKLDSK